MKRAAWVGSLVAVVALASVGCAFQVAGQGQGESVDGTRQSLGQDSTDPGESADDGSRTLGGTTISVSDPDKPTPDPWRGIVSPAKPTPDPWRPGSGSGTSGGDSQGGSNPSSTTQQGQTTQTSAR